MQLCNISVQRWQRSVALNYDVVARCASTNHDTAALTEKLRQNTSYRQLAGMNLGFTRSWQFHLIGSTFAVIFEREYDAFIPPGYAPGSSDWSPCGRGAYLRANWNLPKHLIWPVSGLSLPKIELNIASKQKLHDKRTLSKTRQVSLAPSHSFLCIFWQGKNLRKNKLFLRLANNTCGPW